MLRVVGAVVVLALALVAAGCSDSADQSEERLTRAEFIAQGDAICDRHREFLASIPAEERGPDGWSDRRIEALEQTLDGLAALAPPADDEEPFADAIAEDREGIRVLRNAEPLPDGRHPLDAAMPYFVRGDRPWGPYGFRVCGS